MVAGNMEASSFADGTTLTTLSGDRSWGYSYRRW
ncbi:hypothetical protein ACU8V7_22475 [Zobellia nedashkovskayae]